MPLPDDGLALVRGGEDGGVVTTADARDLQPFALVVPFTENGTAQAALVTPPLPSAPVLLNGYPPLGVTLLRERDEICVAGERLYLGAPSGVEEMPFPDDQAETRCSRCKSPLRPGDAAVRCACRAWSHEGQLADPDEEPRYCFTSDPVTACCARERPEVAWTPEDAA